MASVIPISQGKQPPGSPPSTLHLCRSSGGITNTELEPWITGFTELCEALLCPAPIGKKDGPYYIRGPLKAGCTSRADDNIARVDLVILDGDSSICPETGECTPGAPPPLDAHVALIERGVPHILYSTHSDGMLNKGRRYRILVPTPGMASTDLDAVVDWLIHCLHEAGCLLADVRENHVLSQPWYFPRVPSEHAEYLCYAADSGDGLDLTEALVHRQKDGALPVEKLNEAVNATPVRGSNSLFAQFNAQHNLNWILNTLNANGYTKAGETQINDNKAYRYLSPHSTSGNAGIVVFKGMDSQWHIHSHHGNDPLTRTNSQVSTNDAWDLYRIFEHDGDQKSAIKAWETAQNKAKPAGTNSKIIQTLDNIEKAQPLDPATFPNIRLDGKRNPVPLATIANIRHMLTSYGIESLYDVIGKRIEIRIPALAGSPDNLDNSALSHVVSLAVLNGIAYSQVPAFVAAIADSNQYNPAAEYFTSRPWDGVDRLTSLYAALTQHEDFPEKLKQILILRWLISAVAAAVEAEGFRSRGVLVLQGEQSIGKTAFFRSLISDIALGDRLIKTDLHLDASNKDSITTAISHLIVEIGELDSSFKKDVALLKGFLTGTVDKVRRPYDRKDSNYQRRTVFCASVNSATFLVDDTGNTRWWTIPVTAVNYNHGIDTQQLWAQVFELHQAGEQWWLTSEEEAQLEDHNKGHRIVNAVRDRLESELDHALDKDKWQLMTATDVLRRIGFDNPTNPQTRDCGTYLREHFGLPTRSRGKTRWRVPIQDHDFPGL